MLGIVRSYPWDSQLQGQPSHFNYEVVKASSLIFNSNTWRDFLSFFLILTPGETFFPFVNTATFVVNPFTHLLIFFFSILLHSICKLIKVFIILGHSSTFLYCPKLLLSPSALPWCVPFKIYPVGLLICRPCTVEDKSNVFF